MSSILVIGEVLFDCFPNGDRVLGGAPFNVAWHLRGFGAVPWFASAVGDDPPGREILARMRDWGMSTEGVQIILKGAETGKVEVLDAGGSPEYRIPEDSAWDHFDYVPEETALPRHSPAIVYQGSLFMRHAASRQSAMALARDSAAPRFVDVNLRNPWFEKDFVLELIHELHCLKVSGEELQTLTKWIGLRGDEDLASQTLAVLENRRIAHGFVTLGAEGALWVEASGAIHKAPAYPVNKIVDTVGAGDGSAAVALLGLTSGWSIPDTLERAMEFAGKICSLQGATVQDQEFYNEPFRKWKTGRA